MGYRFSRYFFIILLTAALGTRSNAQAGLCPNNLDFESATFANWDAYTWSVAAPTPVYGVVPGRHTIMDNTSGNDPYGFFPKLCPNGSSYSVRLGNSNTGSERESISYTYTIPAGLPSFSMLFYYAVVLENPAGHPLPNQPRFQARIVDVATNTPVPCVDFDFISSTAPGGFRISPVPGNGGSQVLYKDWTSISINLDAYIGRTIKLEFVTYDCAQNGHFGYAYVDVYTACNGAILGNTICPGDQQTTLTAPFGYQTYKWYSDMTFSTIISNTQTVTFTPPPAVGSVFPVIVGPFPGYGCDDTLYATITSAGAPPSQAGPDINTCDGTQVQIGGPPTAGYNYSWTPTSQVSNPIIANPLAWNYGPPTQFIVTTTDLLTGCSSTDTTIISSGLVDTTMTLSGSTDYCTGDPNPGSLTLRTTTANVQWYNGNTPIPGATGFSYQPTAPGVYWAQLQETACTDSTRVVIFNVKLTPASVAGPDQNICANQSIQIGGPPTAGYNYTWTPANLLNDPTLSDPIATVTDNTPVEFIVITSDPVSGCASSDTVYVTGRVVDTLLTLSGKKDFCVGDPAAGSLSVHNTVSAVQWYDGGTAIPGATGFNFQPSTSGNYWAEIQQFGCTDSTLTVAFGVHAIPVATFTANNDSACITSNSFQFTNTSTVTDGSPMSYVWKFSDGTNQTVTDATKTFSASGSYIVKLVTSTGPGCKDSSTMTVYVMPNGVPDFKWDSICTSRPVSFYNLSNEKGAVQVNYLWDFGRGIPGSAVKNPSPVTYLTPPGNVDVTLKLVTLGCESDTMTVVKTVQVNEQAPGITYQTITVPQGATRWVHVRALNGNIYNWRPTIQLNSYTSRYVEFTAIDDVKYLIDISDVHTCLTRDTMEILVLKKPGYYLPSAFTPNGDGLNDVARPYLVGMKSLKSFSVFNRWGNLIYYTQKEGEGWDGKSKGVDQNTGVYIWALEYYDNSNTLIKQKGTITLIR